MVDFPVPSVESCELAVAALTDAIARLDDADWHLRDGHSDVETESFAGRARTDLLAARAVVQIQRNRIQAVVEHQTGRARHIAEMARGAQEARR